MTRKRPPLLQVGTEIVDDWCRPVGKVTRSNTVAAWVGKTKLHPRHHEAGDGLLTAGWGVRYFVVGSPVHIAEAAHVGARRIRSEWTRARGTARGEVLTALDAALDAIGGGAHPERCDLALRLRDAVIAAIWMGVA